MKKSDQPYHPAVPRFTSLTGILLVIALFACPPDLSALDTVFEPMSLVKSYTINLPEVEEQPGIEKQLDVVRQLWIETELARLAILSQYSSDDRLALLAYQLIRKSRDVKRSIPVDDRDQEASDSSLTVTMDELRGGLDKGETLLSYYKGKENLYLFLLNREHARVMRMGASNHISWLNELFHYAIRDEDLELYKSLSWTLYEELVGPVETFIDSGDKLLIFPDAELYNLPFEMLLTRYTGDLQSQPGSWPYLLKNFQIRYASSFEHFVTNRKSGSTESGGGGLLALAPWAEPHIAGYSSSLPPLPISRYETEQIATIFQERRRDAGLINTMPFVTILFNEEANLTSLANIDLSVYSYFHLASHAVIDDLDPLESSLIFSGPDGEEQRLRLKDLKDIELSAELVTLAGCETARNKSMPGEGLLGFSRILIEQGVRNLLVSVWDVEDRLSARLMIRFYENKAAGASMAEALQQAKLSILEESTHLFPSAWGSFVLVSG